MRRPRCANSLSFVEFLLAQYPRPDPDNSESVCDGHIPGCFSFIESNLTTFQYRSYGDHP